MRGGRHAARKGRHAKQYQGWGPRDTQPLPLDEADELVLAQAGDTPPMGFPAMAIPAIYPAPYSPMAPAPRQPWPAWLRLLVAAGVAFACILLGAILILGAALIAGPPEPAEADVSRETQVQIVVKGDKVHLEDGRYVVTKKGQP